MFLCVATVPLSAASSIALDDAVHRMLSDSMDLLPQKSYSAVAPSNVCSVCVVEWTSSSPY